MKSIKALAAVALASSLFIGCEEEEHFGIDSSKPAPKEFTYDEENSSETSISVYWDDASMIEAGATSATVQLTTELNNGDNYDNGVSHTIVYSDEKVKVKNATTFTGLKKFSQYYIRIRANYPRSVFSDWVYIAQDNEPVQLVLGYGFVKPDFVGIPNLAATPLADAITLKWDPCVNAVKYVVEYKLASASDWTTIETEETALKISDLTDKTAYNVRAKSINKDGKESEYSETLNITTLEKAAFPKDIATADEFVKLFNGKELTTADATSVVNLTADIDLTGKTIPTCATFPGIFNGNNHSIKNWKGTAPLFTEVGTVKDLVIDASCSFVPTASEFGIIAIRNKGELTNVTNKANITMSADAFDDAVICGALVAEGLADITDCHNTGNITVTAQTSMKGAAVAGIAGYLKATMKDCSNEGTISASCAFVNGASTIVNVKNCAPSVGGLVAYGGNDENGQFAVTNCVNKGKVSLVNTSIDSVTENVKRQDVGGIAGASNGDITNCHNYGEVYAKLASSNGSAMSGNEAIVLAGGITGGDYFAAGQIKSNITGCTNEGPINVFSDASKSNSAVGGIVGWPGKEAKQSTCTKDCVNKGDITISGTVKVRAGGVQGGTGNMDNCTNEGEIIFESGDKASVIGSLCGFHSQGNTIENCKAFGKVTAMATVDGIGGLIGNIGNAAHNTGNGCVVDCVISGGAEATRGLVIGKFNGKTKNITLGETSPIKVSGSVEGAKIDAGNFANFVHGTTNYTEGVHVINAVFGK